MWAAMKEKNCWRPSGLAKFLPSCQDTCGAQVLAPKTNPLTAQRTPPNPH